MVGRGATYAGIDGDGDQDILIFGCGQKPRLLRNDQETGNHWLRVKLSRGGQSVIGSSIAVELANGKVLKRGVSPTRSYQSQVELPVTFGLGKNDAIERLVVTWPNGTEQVVPEAKVDQLINVAAE